MLELAFRNYMMDICDGAGEAKFKFNNQVYVVDVFDNGFGDDLINVYVLFPPNIHYKKITIKSFLPTLEQDLAFKQMLCRQALEGRNTARKLLQEIDR